MIADPASAHIFSAKPMSTPEDNDVVTHVLGDVLPRCPHLSTLMVCSVCGHKRAASQNTNLPQLKLFAIDWSHTCGHVGSCQCTPRTNRVHPPHTHTHQRRDNNSTHLPSALAHGGASEPGVRRITAVRNPPAGAYAVGG